MAGVELALGAAALYLLSRFRGGGSPFPSDSSTSGQNPGSALRAGQNYATRSIDLGDVTPDEPDGLAGQPQILAGQQNLYYRHLWRPAAKMRLSELGQDDHVTGLALLSNQLVRRDDLGTLYRDLAADARSNEESSLGLSVVSTVVKNIPVVGTVVGLALDAGSKAAAGVAAGDVATGGLGNLLHLAANPAGISPEAAAMLTWVGQFSPYPQASVKVPGLRVLPTVPPALQNGSAKGAPARWTSTDATKVTPPVWYQAAGSGIQPWVHADCTCPAVFFSCHPGGYLMPWLAVEFNGMGNDGDMAPDVIRRRAPVFRALELFARLAFPAPVGDIRQGCYWYHSPIYGDIRGSVFPPSLEDQRIVAQDGSIFDWDGRPYTRLLPSISQAVGELQVGQAIAAQQQMQEAANAAAVDMARANATEQAANQAADPCYGREFGCDPNDPSTWNLTSTPIYSGGTIQNAVQAQPTSYLAPTVNQQQATTQPATPPAQPAPVASIPPSPTVAPVAVSTFKGRMFS